MPFSRLLLQDNSPFFQKLAKDVRVMIYEELLSGLRFGPILAGLWLQQQETSIILDLKHRAVGYPRVSIDATILRTCMLAYTEAALVLYSHNTISFNNASQIADFRSKGLSKVIVGQNSDQSQKTEMVFTLQPKSLGRLSNIVHLYLIFTQQPDLERAAPWHNENRELIMEAWSSLLFQERQRDESERFSFPALNFLALDFEPFKLKTLWLACQLGVAANNDQVRPFARLFERSSLLERVYIIGVTYKPTIRKLRACLLPNGGVFKIFNWKDGGPNQAELVEASDEE
ncbi:MAG: hypothetical protein Q9195_009140 [Heterodermia aff. obscurata]